MKIIILKRDKLGDLLLTTPLLQTIKQLYPKAKLAVVAPNSSAWILKEATFLDQVYAYPQPKTFNFKSVVSIFIQFFIFLKIRHESYDLAIAAGGEYSHRAIKRLLWIGAKHTVSFVPPNKYIKEITYPVSEPNKNMHESLRMLKLLSPIVKSKKKLHSPDIWFVPQKHWLLMAESFLLKNQLKSKRFIVFGLGARREKKQASKEQIIETALYAYKKYQLKTILVWTPGDKNNKNYPGDDALAYDILKSAPKEILPLRASLELTIGVIWHAKKSIFPDSGLMHFAAASPGGVVGLFADTKVSPNPNQWGPLGHNSNYIEAKESIKELGNNFLHKEINRF
jgi:heptosyltransferase-3